MSNIKSRTDIFTKTALAIMVSPPAEQCHRLLGAEIQNYLNNEEQDASTTLASIEDNSEKTTDQLGRVQQKATREGPVKKAIALGLRF